MLGETRTPVRLVKGVSVPSTQLSIQETAGQGGSRPVCPQRLYQPWPKLWIRPSCLIGPIVWSEAFAASKAFQSGVSLEQILSSCHWK